jgi:hypothetical protein
MSLPHLHLVPSLGLPLLAEDMLVDPPVICKILEEGWSKYFSLGLFTNEKCHAVLFIDQLPVNTVSLNMEGKFVVQSV